jgi:hypothetical protein
MADLSRKSDKDAAFSANCVKSGAQKLKETNTTVTLKMSRMDGLFDNADEFMSFVTSDQTTIRGRMAEAASIAESAFSRTTMGSLAEYGAGASTDQLIPGGDSVSNFSFDDELVQTGVYQRFDQEMSNAELPDYQSEFGAAINLNTVVSLSNMPMPITTIEIHESSFYEGKGTLRRSEESSSAPGQRHTRWKKIPGRRKTTLELVPEQRPNAERYMTDQSHYLPILRRRAVSRPEGAGRIA